LAHFLQVFLEKVLSVGVGRMGSVNITLERAVFVEACQEGWNPQTAVRQTVWKDDTVHEELIVFPSLREALSYAQNAFVTEDGPQAAAA